MLTQKQKELLLLIHERVTATGVPPSFDEMKDALELKSKSGIHRLITALEERGFIRRLPHRARAIEVLKIPEIAGSGGADRGTATRSAGGHGGGHMTVVQGHFGLPRTGLSVKTGQTEVIPVMGRIAAGVPISAIQTMESAIEVSSELTGKGEHFALEVRGDSMIDAGIFEGDIVIVHRCDSADSGDIVVALVDQEEATLKKFRRRGDTIALEAANSAYKTQIYGADRVQIQGRLVALIRRY